MYVFECAFMSACVQYVYTSVCELVYIVCERERECMCENNYLDNKGVCWQYKAGIHYKHDYQQIRELWQKKNVENCYFCAVFQ